MPSSKSYNSAELPIARASESFISFPIDPVQRIELGTSSTAEEEIFASLNFISDIREIGIDFIRRSSNETNKDATHTLQLFQAFVRQAQAFFQSAEKLHYRASPLFFYYSFLNFAKALVCLKRPEIFSAKVHHGISHEYNPNQAFADQVIKISESGVFPLFYEMVAGAKLPKDFRASVPDLLGYMSDIEFEYERAEYGEHKLLPVKIRGFIKPNTTVSREIWAVVAINKFEKLKGCPNALEAFLEMFEEVSLNKYQCERVFNIMAAEMCEFRFFQSKRTMVVDRIGTTVGELLAPTRQATELLFMPSVFQSPFDCFFALPIEDTLRLKFDELLAGYLIFFYLGDLVRYHPDYLERILFSKESWIIQRFTRNCPTTMLRRMALLLIGENRVYFAR